MSCRPTALGAQGETATEAAWRPDVESFTSLAATIRRRVPSESCSAGQDLRQGGVTPPDGILAAMGDARPSPVRSGGFS